MRNINILINEDHSVSFENDYAGLNGENLQGNIVFKFKNFINGQARAEVVINNEDGYILLEKVGETYTMPIRSSLLTSDYIIMQLVIDEVGEDYPIWKSEAFTLKVGYSINAETTIPEDYPTWVQVINGLINDTEQALENIDNALEQVNTAIEETNNLNIDVSKEDTTTTIELTKKDGTTKEVESEDGEDLQFKWEGTSLGVKTSSQSTYQYVDLQGVQGETGPMGSPFTIAKTYSTEALMIADYDNMQVGDYVMIDGDIELQENATLWVKEETPAPTTKWHYLADFSGASGIQGETGATPNIQIGTVTSGATPSVTRTGTNENPVLNFVLQKGDKGDTGNTGATGATGNGISSIEKTAETPSQKDYRINYTNGGHFDYSVENGEVTQAQLDEVIAENDYLNSIIDQIVPKTTATGTSITLDDTLQAKMNMELNPSELTQETTTGKNMYEGSQDFSGTWSNSNYWATDSNTYNGLVVKKRDGVWSGLYKDIEIVSGKTYTFSCYIKSDNSRRMAFYLSGGTSGIVAEENISTTQNWERYSFTFTASASGTIHPRLENINSTQTGYAYICGYQLEESPSMTSYEPYTGGIPAPNPQFPMNIHTISGDNTIKVVGKNIFNINNVEYQTNYTPKVQDNKLVSNSPTAWSSAYYIIKNLSKNTTYYIKSKLSYTSGGGAYSQIFGGSELEQSQAIKTYINNIKTSGNYSTSFNTGDNDTITISFCASGNSGIWELSEIMLSSEDATYEPYQEQLAQVNLGVENLIPKPTKINGTATNTITTNGITYTILGGGIIHISGTATAQSELYMFRLNTENETIIVPAGTYTFSSPSIPNGVKIITSGGDNNGFPYTELSSSLLSKTGNVTDGTKPFNYIMIRIASGTIVDTDLCYQLEKGSIAHSYSPYGQTPIEYSKIGNYADVFYKATDSDTDLVSGKWYIKKNIPKLVLDENSNISSHPNGTNSFEFALGNLYQNGEMVTIMSDYFRGVTWNDRVSGGNNIIYGITENGIKAVIRNTTFASLSDFKTWLGTHNTSVYYIATSPTYTLLNDTLQSQLDTIESMLLSYKGQTNISQVSNDLPFIITSTALKEL